MINGYFVKVLFYKNSFAKPRVLLEGLHSKKKNRHWKISARSYESRR
jgi:hypothetical protein